MSLLDTVKEVIGCGGLTAYVITSSLGRLLVYEQGAHIAEWIPAGERPVLWTSRLSAFERGEPIRGGIPICFPWFGPHPTDGQKPLHGFARLLPWTLLSADQLGDGRTLLKFDLKCTTGTAKQWPADFHATQELIMGPGCLKLSLSVHNSGTQEFTFEEMYHNYFGVGDVRQARVTGLCGATYVDKVDNGTRKVDSAAAVEFQCQTDRLYVNTGPICFLIDPVLRRSIRIEKDCGSTTVWNPDAEKAARMPDFANDEWPGMACVETGNAADNQVTLAPGSSHVMNLEISVSLL